MDRLVAIGQQVPPPTFRLYSLGAMTIGTILGSMLVGLLLASRNFRALGDEDRAHKCFWLGVGGTVLLFAAGVVLPEETPRSAFEVVQVGIVAWYAKREQGELIQAHKILGGRFYSKWRAAGIGLVCCAAIIAAFVVAFQLGILKV